MILPSILLSSGRYLDLVNPEPEQFTGEDIAIGLGNLCRFSGQLSSYLPIGKRFYSVAQHSVIVSNIVPKEFALEGLLHDAQEAFIGDCTKPAKSILPDYQRLERRLELVIREKFNLPPDMSKEVKEADLRMLATERRDLMNNLGGSGGTWGCIKGIDPLEERIEPFQPDKATNLFLMRFLELLPFYTQYDPKPPGLEPPYFVPKG